MDARHDTHSGVVGYAGIVGGLLLLLCCKVMSGRSVTCNLATISWAGLDLLSG